MSFAEDRMKKKVLGATEAIGQGVGKVVFADARIEQPVQASMAGQGTVIE
jgi:acetylglutamate/LysW-gamma-L-alpha-aminoadipate kinase